MTHAEVITRIDRTWRRQVVGVLLAVGTKGTRRIGALDAEEIWQGMLLWMWAAMERGEWTPWPSEADEFAMVLSLALQRLRAKRVAMGRRRAGWDFFCPLSVVEQHAERAYEGGGRGWEAECVRSLSERDQTDLGPLGRELLDALSPRLAELVWARVVAGLSRQDVASMWHEPVKRADDAACHAVCRLRRKFRLVEGEGGSLSLEKVKGYRARGGVPDKRVHTPAA